MKKLFFILGIALMPLMILNACKGSKDDPNLAVAVAGNYVADLSVLLNQTPPATTIEDATITIVRESDTKVGLSLAGFEFYGIEIPVNVGGISLSGKTKNVAVSFTGTVDVSAAFGGSDDFKDLPISITGTITGTNMNLVITLTVPLDTGTEVVQVSAVVTVTGVKASGNI